MFYPPHEIGKVKGSGPHAFVQEKFTLSDVARVFHAKDDQGTTMPPRLAELAALGLLNLIFLCLIQL